MIYVRALLRALRRMGVEVLGTTVVLTLIAAVLWLVIEQTLVFLLIALACWLGHSFLRVLDEVRPADREDMK